MSGNLDEAYWTQGHSTITVCKTNRTPVNVVKIVDSPVVMLICILNT